MSEALQIRLKSLEDGIPDVVVEPPERGKHLPVRYLNALIEDYFDGSAYFYVRLRRGPEI